MNGVLLFLAVLTSTLILAQWYVFSSLRTYLFRRYTKITRRVAYPVLAIIAIGNFLLIKLSFGTDILTPGSFGQQVAAVALFTYLGCVLTLSLYFALLGAVSTVFHLKDLPVRLMARRASSPEPPSARRHAAAGAAQCAAPGCCETAEVPPSCHISSGCAENPATRSSAEVGLHATETGEPDLSRRKFLQWGAATGLATAFVLAGHGISEAYASPVIEEFDIFNPALDGLDRTVTILQVTDFHFGLFYDVPELERLIHRLNEIDGDALVITGDLFHSSMSAVETAIPVLKRLRPRRYGNFAVLGNHDFYTGMERVIACIHQSGVRLLRDEWLTFTEGTATIHLGGIDDPRTNWMWGTTFPRFDRFMATAPHKTGMRVLLSHRPAVLPLASRESLDLVLSGHIHGGQIILPVPGEATGVSIARIASPYTHGWYKEGTCRMYLSRGVGLTFLPWRVNCPSEISVFHLKPSRKPAHDITGTLIRRSDTTLPI